MVDPVVVIDALPSEPGATNTTTLFPVTVDGVRLDSLAWNITEILRTTPARRSTPLVIPGINGVRVTAVEDYEAGQYSLSMFVRGTNPDGTVPGAGSITQYRTNLDHLVHLFGSGYRLLDLRETVATGVVRQAEAQVVDAITPSYMVGSSGELKVSFMIPEAFWQDIATADTNIAPVVAATAYELTGLAGSTAPIADATYLVVGPATNPRINDVYAGGWVILDQVLPAATMWRVNTATWSSRVGSSLTLASSDGSGTDASGTTRHGAGTASYLTLYPVRDSGTRKVRVRMAGTGFTGSTQLSVRYRRKYLL